MKIFLIGMMGAGKTYWAKKLGAKFKTGGYDLDYLISSHEERSIAEIFEEEGEAYFRKTEAQLLRWFGEKKKFILATGGGTPCFHENMNWMNQQGVTIWLDEPVDVLVSRLLPQKAERPLISELSDAELTGFLTKKLAERAPLYGQSQYRLHGETISDKQLNKIIQQYA
jgi:shikimate kinase